MDQQLRTILDEVGGLSRPAAGLGLNDDLFVAGLTSFATTGVMLAIEDEFDLAFPDSMLVRGTFRSLSSLGTAIVGLQDHARAA